MSVITYVLEQLWNHEDEEQLPSDSTALLKCIGWRLAQRMSDLATSSSLDMHKELSGKTRGERGEISLDAYTLSMCRTKDFPANGWCLGRVNHSETNQYTCTGKYEYVYSKTRDGNVSRYVVELSQRGLLYMFARFAIKNVSFYYYSSRNVCAVFLDRDWSLHVSSQMKRMPRSDHYLIESVSWKAAAVTYACYDRTLLKSLIETTFTNSMNRTYAVKKYTHLPAPFTGAYSTSLHKLLHYNERTQLDHVQDPWHTMEKIDSQIAKIAKPIVLNNHLYQEPLAWWSEVSTRLLRRRMYAIALKVLLVKAQWKEEERAQDPIKKCAACAVQAAKDQLVLGLEPAAKRRCA